MSKIKTFIEFGSPAYKTIEKYVRNILATPDAEGIMRIESNQVVTKAAQDLAAQFNSYGVPPSVITKTDDVKNFAGQIANIEQQKIMQAIKKQITPKKSADIVELQTGKKIDQSKGIMGGRQFDQTDDEATKALQDKLAKDKGYQKYRGETEEQIRERFKKQNKEAIERFKKNMDDLEDKATGGRVGLKDGMSRRKFMQIMGGLAALPVVGKFFKTGKVAAPVVEKAAEAASGAPSYFFDLVEKIKLLGVRSKGFKERSESFRYKDYDMDIDYDTGDIQIKKTREAMIPGGDEAGIAEESIMVYRPGRADELTKGKTPPDEYDEYTARPDMDGKMKDVDDGLSENVEKEIIDEVSEKMAGGGIARMLGE